MYQMTGEPLLLNIFALINIVCEKRSYEDQKL